MPDVPVTGAALEAVQKALTRLQATVDSGSYYEGQQIIKTVYHRSRTRKQLNQSYQLLEGAARIQLRAQQTTCGLELGQLLIEAYTTDGMQPEGVAIQRIEAIMQDFEAVPTETYVREDAAGTAGEMSVMDQYLTLSKRALKWVYQCGNKEAAGPLHERIAAYIMKVRGWQGLSAATPHYVRASNMKPFAAALHSTAAHCELDEEQLLLLRAILQVLVVAGGSKQAQGVQVSRAQQLLDAYLATAASTNSIQQAPGSTFIRLMLLALTPGKASPALFRNARNLYLPLLQTDKALLELQDKVEGVFFGLGGGGPLGGMLGDMFKSLMMGEDDEL